MNRFRHLILTRFNVRMEGREPPSPEWLEHRLNVFERFCFPSVRAQTTTNFDWIVYCHPEMPESIRERIHACSAWRQFRPVFFRGSFSQSMVQAAISELVTGFTHLITTRLDNDDAISKTFVETIQNRFTGQEFEFLNFTSGYIWKQGKLYSGRHTTNAFISLVERTSNYSTVYCGNHMELHRVGPITQIHKPAGWMQVVHDRNLLNCVWGQPHALEKIHESFGLSAETLSGCR
ncbi:MAG TPA: glycosyltransferase [Bryobacteraceae bacterium]